MLAGSAMSMRIAPDFEPAADQIQGPDRNVDGEKQNQRGISDSENQRVAIEEEGSQ